MCRNEWIKNSISLRLSLPRFVFLSRLFRPPSVPTPCSAAIVNRHLSFKASATLSADPGLALYHSTIRVSRML